ncbi:hypothetical protein BC938DRAFT_475138 [Jimgerdemannia flammicorona]|uniref:Uncharacterized protein n=1 Tax=Jimgerdemannia flammicorona TaxID=994334 RepID=A0A433QZJ2_9FUNG|nr:hypothetical protein BC938DRAFT_475138 [Jimgerdemannia flammicorona]
MLPNRQSNTTPWTRPYTAKQIPVNQRSLDMEDDDEFGVLDLNDTIVRELDLICTQAIQHNQQQQPPPNGSPVEVVSHAPQRGNESAVGDPGGVAGVAARQYTSIDHPTHTSSIDDLARLQNDLATKDMQAKDGEIFVVRRNMMRADAEKDQLRCAMAASIAEAQRERDSARGELARQAEKFKTEMAFKKEELDSIIKQRNREARREQVNGTTGESSSSPILSPLKTSSKGKGPAFPTLNTFNESSSKPLFPLPIPAPAVPSSPPRKLVRSVAVMTDLEPSPPLEPTVAVATMSMQRSDAMDVDVNGEGGEGGVRRRKRRRTGRRLVPEADERMVLMQRLFADVVPDTAASRPHGNADNSDEQDRRSIHALISDRFLMAERDEPVPAHLQARYHRLMTGMLDCLTRALEIEMGPTLARLLGLAEGFLGVCLESRTFAILKPVIGVVRVLAASYPTFRTLAMDKGGRTDASQPIVDALISVLAVYASSSSSSLLTSDSENQSREIPATGVKWEGSNVERADAVAILETLRNLTWGCEVGQAARLEPFLSTFVTSRLLSTNQPCRIVLYTIELLASAVVDDALYKIAMSPLSSHPSTMEMQHPKRPGAMEMQRPSAMERAVRFLTERPGDATAAEVGRTPRFKFGRRVGWLFANTKPDPCSRLQVVEVRAATLRLVACACVQSGREATKVVECAAMESVSDVRPHGQVLPRILDGLSTELEALATRLDPPKKSLQFVRDAVQLLHHFFLRHPNLYDRLKGATAQRLFVAMTRLSFAREMRLKELEGMSGEFGWVRWTLGLNCRARLHERRGESLGELVSEISNLAHDLVEAVITLEEEDAVASLFKVE